MQSEPIIVYRRSWCEDSDAAVAYFNRQKIEYKEVDIEQDETAAQGVEFLTGGHQVTPTLVYRMQAIVCDPWTQARFDAWWQFANTDFPDAQ
ncbi:MAG: glutaredoxin family protein [Chloroflexota bacterium]